MVEDSPSPPRIGPAMVAYIAAFLAAIYVWLAWHPQGLALALTIASPGWRGRPIAAAGRARAPTPPNVPIPAARSR